MCHVDYAYKVGMLRNYSFFDLQFLVSHGKL